MSDLLYVAVLREVDRVLRAGRWRSGRELTMLDLVFIAETLRRIEAELFP